MPVTGGGVSINKSNLSFLYMAVEVITYSCIIVAVRCDWNQAFIFFYVNYKCKQMLEENEELRPKRFSCLSLLVFVLSVLGKTL